MPNRKEVDKGFHRWDLHANWGNFFFLTFEVVSSAPKEQVVTISPLYNPSHLYTKKHENKRQKEKKNRKKNQKNITENKKLEISQTSGFSQCLDQSIKYSVPYDT